MVDKRSNTDFVLEIRVKLPDGMLSAARKIFHEITTVSRDVIKISEKALKLESPGEKPKLKKVEIK